MYIYVYTYIYIYKYTLTVYKYTLTYAFMFTCMMFHIYNGLQKNMFMIICIHLLRISAHSMNLRSSKGQGGGGHASRYHCPP